MKKLFVLILLCLSTIATTHADEITKFKANSFAYRSVDNYGNWSEWSDWEDCSILIVMNLTQDRIQIYSKEQQEYDIISYYDPEDDKKGGTSMEMECVDIDGIKCGMRYRQLSDGTIQLYVDYPNFMFVYNITKK